MFNLDTIVVPVMTFLDVTELGACKRTTLVEMHLINIGRRVKHDLNELKSAVCLTFGLHKVLKACFA